MIKWTKHAKLTIPGEPFGKQVIAKSPFSQRRYIPKKTESYMGRIVVAWKTDWYVDLEPLRCAIRCDIWAYYGIPKSASKKKRAAMLADDVLPTKKPDRDNIAKVVGDALNGYAWHDDALIASGVIEKRYAEIPRVEITIYKQEVKHGNE